MNIISDLYNNILKTRNDILGVDSYDLEEFESWTIQTNPKLYEYLLEAYNQNYSYMLDTSKEKFTLIEKIVYDLAMFHFTRLNIEYDPEIHHIEYWTKRELIKSYHYDIHNFHVDKDESLLQTESKYKFPILSTVTYLNDSTHPTVISNIKTSGYKTFCPTRLLLSFPKTLKHICFKGNNYHGVHKVLEQTSDRIEVRKTLMFNIWENHKPLKVYRLIKDCKDIPNNFYYSKSDQILGLVKTNEKNNKVIIIEESDYDLIIKNILGEKVESNVSIYEKYLGLINTSNYQNIKFIINN